MARKLRHLLTCIRFFSLLVAVHLFLPVFIRRLFRLHSDLVDLHHSNLTDGMTMMSNVKVFSCCLRLFE